MSVPLVAVAHGSRDSRSAASINALAQTVRARRPDLDLRVSFLDLSAPRLPDVLAGVSGDGHDTAVVVPLLLGNAFHARVDVPRAVRDAANRYQLTLHTADVLGPDTALEDAAEQRLDSALSTAGVAPNDPELGVVVAGAGSSRESANELVRDVAGRWSRRRAWAGARAAFAAAAEPAVPDAVRDLRAAGARRIAVASWFLAPGLLPDRIYAAAREHRDPGITAPPVLAEPMSDGGNVADLVVRRYAAALDAPATRPAVDTAVG